MINLNKKEYFLTSKMIYTNLEKEYNYKKNDTIIYKKWEKNKDFASFPDNRLSYVVIMPPPNITGDLHVGHILNNTIQDILVRKARLEGFNTCWVPGLDHASIATELKLINELKKKGCSKQKIGFKKFLNLAKKWKLKYSKNIIEQLKKIGCSCDWNRLKFSMDAEISKSVKKIFITLANSGFLYRNYGIVNWDCKTHTAISNEEILYKTCRVKLYYIKYQIQNDTKYIIAATKRPETIFADSALCVNPKDKRYVKFRNKKAIVPISLKVIPIIADNYIDQKFGTGCVKITPAHDFNDKLIAERHKLEFIKLIDKNGTLNEYGLNFSGETIKVARKNVIYCLKKYNNLLKVEQYHSQIGFSERSNTEVEQLLSTQWFVKMNFFAKKALNNIHKNDFIKLYPQSIKKKIKDWFVNLKDWNISRQLWWGHRIPKFYKKDSDIEVLDTWFSACIWPVVVFNGIEQINNSELQYYYPTTVLVTGKDILFFWVIRMILAGLFFLQKKPFKNIYFHGLVKDKNLLKMSKSLGNSPNLKKILNEYGADTVRSGILIMAHFENDIVFDKKVFFKAHNIKNKLWNALKLIAKFKLNKRNQRNVELNNYIFLWIENKFNILIILINKLFERFKLSKVFILINNFFKKHFCSIFLEILKKANLYVLNYLFITKLYNFFRNILIMYHPFIPFITEYIWTFFPTNSTNFKKSSLIHEKWPSTKKVNIELLKEFQLIYKIILQIRKFRLYYNFSKQITIYISKTNYINKKTIKDILILLGNIKTIRVLDKITGYTNNTKNYMFVSDNEIYIIKKHITKKNKRNSFDNLTSKISYYKIFLKQINSKLTNDKFLNNVPEKILKLEKQKRIDCINKIKFLNKILK
ncbi:valine--tRNA ligase [Candidatus Karelsulcia muelleri]|uniref:valine--tRNA ligase n=1 Tax=Candidatus Karelsulcia muelleri TaxID=336810 RepID=UPI0023637AFB|nr:valine--tRNA ligase [Candidatus Karelsulcia muelleri]WDE42282.1 valine--tRNA ligase [Candidatus Karelsulcia muelleri]WDR79131.1 valine--tRNA ligase [Candidatus Karelsulcia muelleri]